MNNTHAHAKRAHARMLATSFRGATALVAPIQKTSTDEKITILPKGLSFWG